jgi:hypothetical protein
MPCPSRRQFFKFVALSSLGVFTPSRLTGSDHAAKSRQQRTLQRRERLQIIVHRGASEFAHENTLPAYRASLDLGADGNEIDIRATRDGVLVCFHDDMLDHLLEAYGTVTDYDWEQLRGIPFRQPGWLGKACRIPRLEEVLELHAEYAGLLHLDVKQPDLGPAIARLLDHYDLWGQLVAVNNQHGEGLLDDPRFRPGKYKGSLYADRAEVDPHAIRAMLARPGDMVIVDDPRGVLVHLERPLGQLHLQMEPLESCPSTWLPEHRCPEELLAILRDRNDCETLLEEGREVSEGTWQRRARAIVRRAEAAEEVRRRNLPCESLRGELARLVRERSFHRDWLHHGLDGAAALRALAQVAPDEFPTWARLALWRDDPAVEHGVEPAWSYPRAWKDFRTKVIVFPLLERVPGEATESICLDYLELSDDEAERLGPPQFEAAARTLLVHRGKVDVASRLLEHRRRDVRGRTILDCVARYNEPWAHEALRRHAPHALQFRAEAPR